MDASQVLVLPFEQQSPHYHSSSESERTLHQNSYGTSGLCDSSLLQTPSLLSPPPSNTLRSSFSGRRNVIHDTSYPSSHILTDSGSSSINTSPNSEASSLTNNTYTVASTICQEPIVHNFNQAAYPTASHILPGSYVGGSSFSGISAVKPLRFGAISDPTTTVLNAIQSSSYLSGYSPPQPSNIRQNYATSTPGLYRHFHPSSHDPFRRYPSGYAHSDPAKMMSTPSVLQSGSYSMPTTVPADSPPFLAQENLAEIYSDGTIVRPQIDSKIEKGFFLSADNCWTCYRRNYFAVQCSYTLAPHPTGRPLQLVKDKETSTIQAMAVTLTAAVDGAQGKSIELVQHTPKRDKGPQSTIGMVKLSPQPPGGISRLQIPQGYPLDTFGRGSSIQGSLSPYLPLQNSPEPSSSSAQQSADANYGAGMALPSTHQHTFERIQFKSATANNGKRRAQQQYYHLIVELHANVRQMGEKDPKWVKVAQRVSQAVVVRGRSPSHYQNEGPHSARNPSVGGSGNGGVGYAAYGAAGYVPNSLSYGIGGSTTAYNSYSRPAGAVFSTMEPNPMGSFSNSSASSLEMLHDAKPAIMSPDIDAINDIKPLGTINPFSYFKSRTFSLPRPPVSMPPVTIPPLSIDLFSNEEDKKEDASPAFPVGGLSSAWSTMAYGRDDTEYS